MNCRLLAATFCIAAMVAGCSEYAGPKETSGAVIGGVAGGLLGNTIGHGQGRAAATILGAAFGAVVGGAVGRDLDDRPPTRLLRRQLLRDKSPPRLG
jgi:uncharacterized protein YcfJ